MSCVTEAVLALAVIVAATAASAGVFALALLVLTAFARAVECAFDLSECVADRARRFAQWLWRHTR